MHGKPDASALDRLVNLTVTCFLECEEELRDTELSHLPFLPGTMPPPVASRSKT